MSKLITTAALALAFSAVAASSAIATIGPAMLTSRLPITRASNTAAVAGNTGPNLAGASFVASSARVACADDDLHITTPLPTNTVHATPTFSGCVFSVSGTPVATSTIDHNCEWTATAHHATFNTTTGATSDITLDICELTLTIPAVGCTIHVTESDEEPGVSLQNITSTGANDTSASPWGSRITAGLTGLHYITTGSCPGLPSTGSASYSAALYARNIWAML
jgi:hypothetical protein